jgi:hypothetical protein
MAGGKFSLANLFGITLRESANDGSDFTNPDADYRRVFLGEDGQLHGKDSSGTVTDIGGSVADILDLPTAETDDTLVLAPDGAGGVEFRAEAGGGGSISYATADCTSDQAVTVDTPTDAPGASISLAAGTWLIFGQLGLGGASGYAAMSITDSSNNPVAYGRSDGGQTELSCHAIVTPGSTTTYKLRGWSSAGSIIKQDATNNVRTRITAIKLA